MAIQPHLDTSEITDLLDRCRHGDGAARDAIFERLYPELRKIAVGKLSGAPAGATITPTVLVHEAYLRLVANDRLDIETRRHFFTSAARAMRHILIDYARRAGAQKRGGSRYRVDWTENLGGEIAGLDWIDLDRALKELARIDQRGLSIIELRFFAGLSNGEIAEVLEISSSTFHRDWQRARAFLHTRMSS